MIAIEQYDKNKMDAIEKRLISEYAARDANSAPPACRFRFKRRGRSDTNGAGFRPIGVNIRARVIVPS